MAPARRSARRNEYPARHYATPGSERTPYALRQHELPFPILSPAAMRAAVDLISMPVSAASQFIAIAQFERRLDGKRHQRQKSQQRRHRERNDEIIFVVENFNMQRHRISEARNTATADGNRAEPAHSAGLAAEQA